MRNENRALRKQPRNGNTSVACKGGTEYVTRRFYQFPH